MLSQIKEQTGLFDQRQMGPVITLNFHPNRLMLAAGSLDYRVSVFSSPDVGEKVGKQKGQSDVKDSSSSSSHYR